MDKKKTSEILGSKRAKFVISKTICTSLTPVYNHKLEEPHKSGVVRAQVGLYICIKQNKHTTLF